MPLQRTTAAEWVEDPEQPGVFNRTTPPRQISVNSLTTTSGIVSSSTASTIEWAAKTVAGIQVKTIGGIRTFRWLRRK
jgi:hypothetical protein